MIRTHRSSTTAVLIVCLLGTASSEVLFASDGTSSSPAGQPSPSADSRAAATEDVSTISATAPSSAEPLPGTIEFVRSFREPSPLILADVARTNRSLAVAPDESGVFAQRGYRGRGYSGRNNGAAAAMFVGAAAAIVGTALLVYANRPECNIAPTAGGCGYGAKVVGGAVLSGGIAGLAIGALTWR